MNLLNKKIKDKIKLLDDIDKQYIPKVKSKTGKNNIPIKKENDDEYINSFEKMKKAQNENFDKVYSNFVLVGNILEQNYNNNKRNHSKSNNNYDKYPTKDDSSNFEYNNIGDRLNNYGKIIKSKIELQRRINDSKIKNKAKPIINQTRNNKNIKKNNSKSNSKISNNNNKSKSKQKSSDKKIMNTKSNFTYHPELNKKSLLLAKKLGPSSIRLTKKKKIQPEQELKPNIFYVNLNKHRQNNTSRKNTNNKDNNKNKNNNKTIYDKMNNLYLRGIEQKQKREKKINEIQKSKEDEYKNYPYKPKINKIIPYYSTKNKIKKNLTIISNASKNKQIESKGEFKNNSIYEKNYEWKKKIEKENIKKKKISEEKIKNFCTFHPNISEHISHTSNKKIKNKVLEQINTYVYKRRQNIKYKKFEENYKRKKFYIDGEGYTPRSTIPHEFEFQTELRERSLGKNKNRSCENFHINKNNKDKNSFKKNLGNNEHFWFFKEEMNTNGYNYNNNIYNINESNGTKEANPHIQFDFIEAVNLLHEKLDKLNI